MVALLVLLLAAGCSIRKFAAGQVANSLTSGPDVFGTDDDPELVGDAIPFGLKMMESLLQTLPDHEGLLLQLCRGFTQYSYGYVLAEADEKEATDHARATELRERALRLFLRARGYGLRGLEHRHRGIGEALRVRPDSAAAVLKKNELPMLYWTAAAWGSAISAGKDRPDLVADFPAVKALMVRALALDERYEDGAVHDAMISLEALPAMMGGSAARARDHYRRELEITGGRTAGPYVTLATSVSVMEQNRAEFDELLHKALEVDPDRDPSTRLMTLLLQRRARYLIDHEDDWFLESLPSDTTTKESR